MHLSEHIAIKGVESLSESTKEGCGALILSHLHPPTLKHHGLFQAWYIHPFRIHLQSANCILYVLRRWMGIMHIPMPLLEKTNPMAKSHKEKVSPVLSYLSMQLECKKQGPGSQFGLEIPS